MTLPVPSGEQQMTALQAALCKYPRLTQTSEILELHILAQIPPLTQSSSQLAPISESVPRNSWY